VQGFEFGMAGIWAHSQKRENLEKLKQFLTDESNKIYSTKENLHKQQLKLEKLSKGFEDFLKGIEDDWVRRNVRIRSTCPTCETLLNELAKLERGAFGKSSGEYEL
jgi:hypothetical protein